MTAWCRVLVSQGWFNVLVLGVIAFNAILVGLETSPSLVASHGAGLDVLDTLVQAVFAFEIIVRLLAFWPRPARFFLDGWNVFDFVVVAASFLPQAGSFATVARLARLLRITRLISRFPELRLIVATMLRSIPSMGHVLLLLGLIVYVYAVLGYHLFHEADPGHWGSLGRALLTVFQLLTLEGFVELQATVLAVHGWAWLYFMSFVLVAVFVVVNLFIAVVINNLEAAKLDLIRGDADPSRAILASMADLRDRLDELERHLTRLAPAVQARDGSAAATAGRPG
jgi:voltage-gated sodium channel